MSESPSEAKGKLEELKERLEALRRRCVGDVAMETIAADLAYLDGLLETEDCGGGGAAGRMVRRLLWKPRPTQLPSPELRASVLACTSALLDDRLGLLEGRESSCSCGPSGSERSAESGKRHRGGRQSGNEERTKGTRYPSRICPSHVEEDGKEHRRRRKTSHQRTKTRSQRVGMGCGQTVGKDASVQTDASEGRRRERSVQTETAIGVDVSALREVLSVLGHFGGGDESPRCCPRRVNLVWELPQPPTYHACIYHWKMTECVVRKERGQELSVRLTRRADGLKIEYSGGGGSSSGKIILRDGDTRRQAEIVGRLVTCLVVFPSNNV